MNLRPPGYEPDELPSCSTPRHSVAFIGDIDYYTLFQRFCQEGAESFFAAEAEDENAAADLLSRKPAATPIHAPPRGATCAVPADFNELLEISIHAPPRGATCLPLDTAALTHFNSRPSARGDGAWRLLGLLESHFNSRPSARGDRWRTTSFSCSCVFQFTPLREGRPPAT